MTPLRFFFFCAGLAIAFSGAADLRTRDHGPIYPVVEQVNPDIRLVRLSPDVAVEQIRGASAMGRLRQLMDRQPQAFAESRRKWLARGYTPTQEVFIERTIRTSTGERTQTSRESNAQGEILFWSYDGPGYTWQGSIYVEIYSNNTASVWDGQIDTSVQNHPWVFQEMTWSGGGGGYGGPDDQYSRTPVAPLKPGVMSRTGGIQLASDHRTGNANGILPIGFYQWAVCWRAGVVGGCTAAAIGCTRVKAAWPACFAMWCIGAEVGSAISCAM